jgi:AraC-like DNA-binding protein
MSLDTLSDVLQAVRLTGAVFYWVEASAPWIAVAPPAREVAGTGMLRSEHVMEFHIVLDGPCWAGPSDGPMVQVQPGDVIVFPQGDPHIFASAPELRAPPTVVPLDGPVTLPIVVRLGQDGALTSRFVCGFVGCDARPFNPLLAALPRMLRVPSNGTSLADLVRIAVAETEARRAGGELLRARLAEMMFVEAVRIYLDRLPQGASGWLGGLRDPHVGRALALLHQRPAHPWTLDELARAAGLSRTPLHERFSELVGQPPIQYLTCWRMQVAASRLTRSTDKIAAIALEVGYESEAAFNRAFKRLVGVPPAAWRRERNNKATA